MPSAIGQAAIADRVIGRGHVGAAKEAHRGFLAPAQSRNVAQRGSGAGDLAEVVPPREGKPWTVPLPLIAADRGCIERIVRIGPKDSAKWCIEDKPASLRAEIAQAPISHGGVELESTEIYGADPYPEPVELVFPPRNRKGNRCGEKDVEFVRRTGVLPVVIGVNLQPSPDILLETSVALMTAADRNRSIEKGSESG